MGCGASKNKIHVNAGAEPIDNTKVKETTESSQAQSRPNSRRPNKSRNQSATSKKSSAWGSQDSLGDHRSGDTRGGSAVSKASKHSMDSGFSDKDYDHVITESSNPETIKEVEENFDTPRDLDLGVVGQQCKQRLSAKDRERLDEQRVLASLQQEGLITKTVARKGQAVRFDIVQADLDAMFGVEKKRPPPRLEKLEKTRKKKKLTEADIEAKLAKAEQRRKEQEQQRLAKIQAVTMKSDVQNALDAFAGRQKDIDITQKSKEELALENRMKKLQEKKERLRAKQEHAEAVRRRKMLAPMRTEEDDEEDIRTHKKITEDTPVAASLH